MNIELNIKDRKPIEYKDFPVGDIGYILIRSKKIPVIKTMTIKGDFVLTSLQGNLRYTNSGPNIYPFYPGESINITF